MFTVVVQEKGGKTQRLQFNKNEITVGRVQGNDIVLPKGNVSKRHSKIVFKEGKFIVVDLKSTNGTYINGHKINSPQVIKTTDKVFIGDFVLEIEEGAGAGGDAANAAPPPPIPPGPGPGLPPPNPGPGAPPLQPGAPGPIGGMGPGVPPRPMPPNPGPPNPLAPQQRPNGPQIGPPMGGAGAPRPMPPNSRPPGAPGAWQEVSTSGNGPSYHFLSIQGGWLISAANSMVFIADPNHQNPPTPS